MFIRFVSTATLLAVVGATALAADAPARDASTRDTSTRDVPTTDSDSGTTDERLVERVTVTADRLPDEREPVEDVPASITVIDREAIERSGASTVQELLARQAGITLYDQVGNGVQTTLDLRGFTDGSGVRVFLDGAPLNDTRNNALSLELVPLDAIERVEIVRGSASALAGGGAEAGVIQLTSRAGGPFGGSFLLSSGSDAVRGLSGGVRGRSGAIDYHASATHRRSDGFRVNSGGRLTRATAGVGIDLGRDRRLEIALSGGTSDFGTPGALTVEEARADRRQAPYNEPDFAEERLGQATLNVSGPLSTDWRIAANLFVRNRASSILTTGRTAAAYGSGALLDGDARALGSTVQLGRHGRLGGVESRVTLGAEWLDGETDATLFLTPVDDPLAIDAGAPASNNRTDRRTLGLYAQTSWRVGADWTIDAGARYDRDRVGYRDLPPLTATAGARRFEELSVRAGATWRASERQGLWLAYGEGFLPPTAEAMFAFPGFGSNPDLRPEDSASYELGWRGTWSTAARLSAAAFVIDTDDEIVFTPPDTANPFGLNRNAGATRRRGVELTWDGAWGGRWSASATATAIDAEFRSGAPSGNRVPLVPTVRLGAEARVDLGGGIAVTLDLLHVGEQVLDNDDANAEPRLAAYTVAGLRGEWRARRSGATAFAELTNLLDRDYSTRGIAAFDLVAGRPARFVTPAPGRRVEVGLGWRF